MQVGIINSQNFKAQRFSLPIGSEVELYKEYSNPNAQNLYNLAQKTINLKERASLYSKMGDYTIIDKRNTYKSFQKSFNEYVYGKGISGFFRKLFNIPRWI